MPSDDVTKLGKNILSILEKFGELELQDVTLEADELVLKMAAGVASMVPRAIAPGSYPQWQNLSSF